MRRLYIASLLLAASILAGCVPAGDTQSFVNPAFDSLARYDSFVAYGAFKDLAVEGRFEKAMCKALAAARHACTPMLSIATPTQPQDGASRQRAATRSGAEATLIIELADPESLSRRLLADGRPGFRVSVVDTNSQRIVARLAIDPDTSANDLARRSRAVSRATVDALRRRQLLQPR